ncbi:MAG: HD domain-containing protein [Clostridia bacterium]|nr:HD domain-containing protein [Clostridia bacterium]
MKMRKVWFCLLITLAVLMGLSGCETKSSVTAVKNGVIDLRSWDFNRGGTLTLNGEWEFYWSHLLEPKDFHSNNSLPGAYYIKVPAPWANTKVNEKNLTSTGYGTYKLNIKIDESERGTYKAVYIPEVRSAYKLWINGDLLATSGTVGKNRKEMVAQNLPKIVVFKVESNEIQIIMQVSNFYQKAGGIWREISLGDYDRISAKSRNRIALDLFVAGSLIIMGFYYLGIYFLRKKEQSALFFGILCTSMGFVSFLYGEIYLIQVFPALNWEWFIKMNYIGVLISLVAFLKFVHSLFPDEFSRYVIRINELVSLAFGVVVIATPALIHNKAFDFFQALMVADAIYVMIVFVLAMKRKRDGAVIACSGGTIVVLTTINDMLYNSSIIHTGDITAYGIFTFLLSQSFVLSKKYSNAFNAVEELSVEIVQTQKEVIFTLGEIAETRSKETGNHVKRVAEYSKLLALKYGLSADEAELIKLAAPMHDIGKVAISDTILNKPGKLTPEEFEIMKTHSAIGYEMLKHSNRPIIKAAAIITLQHHEKYNGKGYPQGLKGEEIHLYGRITAVADVFDALASERVYKKAWELDKILELFEKERGEHFDPKLIDIFFHNLDDFVEIKNKYTD